MVARRVRGAPATLAAVTLVDAFVRDEIVKTYRTLAHSLRIHKEVVGACITPTAGGIAAQASAE
jgi:hypothetical protein